MTAIGIAAVLVAGAAYAVVRSQEEGRASLRDRLADRAKQAGRFTTQALLSSNEAASAKLYFGGPAAAVQAAVDEYQSTDPLPRVVILDARARVLAVNPSVTPQQRRRFATDPLVGAALRGQPGVSNVFTAPGGDRAFEVAIPFATKHGRRVWLKAAPVAALQAALGGYLPSAPAVPGGHAYLVDARDRVLASSTGRNVGKLLADAKLQAAVHQSRSGIYNDRYFVSVPAGRNGWRAVFTAPTDALYAPVEGSRRLTAWLLFAAFTLAVVALLAVGATALYRSARLAHERLHDSLTGLPTRALFIDRVDRALAGVHRRELAAAVFFIDLDGFKLVNDRFGHAAGDELLRETANRLREVVRWIDTLGRLGGDEFLVLAEELADDDQAAQIATRIQQTLARPIAIGNHEVAVQCSIGIAIHHPGDPPLAAVRLMHDADVAMYRAKRRGGRRYEFFDTQSGGGAEPRDVDLEPSSPVRSGDSDLG